MYCFASNSLHCSALLSKAKLRYALLCTAKQQSWPSPAPALLCIAKQYIEVQYIALHCLHSSTRAYGPLHCLASSALHPPTMYCFAMQAAQLCSCTTLLCKGPTTYRWVHALRYAKHPLTGFNVWPYIACKALLARQSQAITALLRNELHALNY